MGIEPKKTAHQSLQNVVFREAPTAACDWRADFRVMRGGVGSREPSLATSDVVASIDGRRTVYVSIRQLSTMPRPSVFASQDP